MERQESGKMILYQAILKSLKTENRAQNNLFERLYAVMSEPLMKPVVRYTGVQSKRNDNWVNHQVCSLSRTIVLYPALS